MNPTAVLDRYGSEYENVQPTDTNYAQKRIRWLGFLNHVNAVVTNDREWEWMYGVAAVIIAIGDNFSPPPSDYGGGAHQTRLFRDDYPDPLTYVSPGRMLEIRKAYPGLGDGGDNSWSVFASGSPSVSNIQFPYTATVDTPHTMAYRRRQEVLIDDDTDMFIPDRYLDSVILPGLVMLAKESTLDGRGIWGKAFSRGLNQMIEIENPSQNQIQMLPMRKRLRC